MTNREWLKSLNNEELLEKIHILCSVMHGGRCPEEVTCKDCQLKWLNAENKEQTKRQKMKQEFVCRYLSPLLKVCDADILGATYDIEDGDEIVTIEHDYGDTPTKVRVNMDNPMALCRDVFRALGDN